MAGADVILLASPVVTMDPARPDLGALTGMYGRGGPRRAALALALSLVLGLSGCARWLAPTYDEVVPTRVAGPEYDELYPRYVSLCAISQFRKRDGELGGAPGHAVMFLKGACVDPDAPYPRLRRCPVEGAPWGSPEHGAGISVNRYFKNVNWVATPGADLLFNGGLTRRDRLTEEVARATTGRAIALGMFEGVEWHEDGRVAEFETLEDIVHYESLGTDFALRFGRSVFCASMPVTEQMLDEVMGYLNDLNAEYFSGEADYQWSGYSDNCVHTLRNALAAAGIWKRKSVNSIRLRQIFNLAVPANEFVNLGRLGSDFPVSSFSAVYGDEVMRAGLLERGWLPTRHGALVQSVGVHQNNEVYDTRFRLFVLQNPFTGGTSRAASRMLRDARRVDVDTNLYFWQQRYGYILARRPERERSSLRSRAWLDAEQEFYDYIAAQLADVEGLIERFLQMER